MAGAEGSLPLTPNGAPKTPPEVTQSLHACSLPAGCLCFGGGRVGKAPAYLAPSGWRFRLHLGVKGRCAGLRGHCPAPSSFLTSPPSTYPPEASREGLFRGSGHPGPA